MGITRKGRFKTPDFALDYCVESELNLINILTGARL